MRDPAFNRVKINSEALRQKLKIKHLETKNALLEKYPEALKVLTDKGIDPSKLREHSAKIIGAGILTGSLLLNPQTQHKTLPSSEAIVAQHDATAEADAVPADKILIETFKQVLPQHPKVLTREEEKFLEYVIQNLTGVKARATLEGEHLNTTYGKIGLEQHLRRYPGDTVSQHSDDQAELRAGMAPGKGAWGYFASSKDKLTPDLEETEKWYAVVQTLYLPDWNTRQPYLRDWYKYRKVLIVNTKNGNAVVASVADSGPAMWTGKNFGGSPEVMISLGGPKYTKGPVILFFVDDPENKVPLGPVEYNELNLNNVALVEAKL